MGIAFLTLAILCEVAGTMSLRQAVRGRKVWYLAFVAANLAAFGLLTLALREGVPLGAAYGIWAASGVALTAILGKLIFKDPLTLLMGTGIGLIIVGVLLVDLSAIH